MKYICLILATLSSKFKGDGSGIAAGEINVNNPLRQAEAVQPDRIFLDHRIHFLDDAPEQYEYYPTIQFPPSNSPRTNTRNFMANVLINPNAFEDRNVSYAVTKLGLGLMKDLNPSQNGNVIISPYSIATLLALLQQGANGETQDQISKALHMSPQNSADSYEVLNNQITGRTSTNNILNVAANMFVSQNFALNSLFRRIASNSFRSEVTPISFVDRGKAVLRINSWVADKTNNMIDSIVTSDTIGENTELVLVNAMYFKGFWETNFKIPATRPGPFRLKSGAPKTVPYMHTTNYFRSGFDSINDVDVAVLPFKGGDFTLVIILPSETSSVEDALSSLTYAHLEGYQHLRPQELNLVIPKFTIKADTELNIPLKKLGITNIFNRYSDLTNLGTSDGISPQVSSALHSAMLSIDEEGGRAAAATAFAAVALSLDSSSTLFKVDRPFIAVLWDTKVSLPLIMARIENP